MKSTASLRAWAIGTLAVGTLDILAAAAVVTLRGGSSGRMLRGIASGLIGSAAVEGGAVTAALGLALHFVVAGLVVAAYHAAARPLPGLRARPFLWGPVYGVVVYAVMSAIVVPLSAIEPGPPATGAILRGLAIHVAFVGLPAALSTRLHLAPNPSWQP